MHHVPFTVASLLFTAAFVPAQQTIVVSGGGAALRNAVGQAAAGDTLVVRAGSYEDVVVSKGLSILCDPGVSIFSRGHPRVPLAIVDLPAGPPFAMRGGLLSFAGFANELTIVRCEAAVVLEGVSAARTFIRDSRQVSCLHMPMSNGCDVANSGVSFVGCTIAGCFRFDTVCSSIHADHSTIEVSGGTVIGSDQLLRPAGRAISAIASRVTVTGDATTLLAGGNPGAAAIDLQGGQLRLDPIVQLASSGSEVITGTGAVTRMPIPWVDAAAVASGQLFTATSHGEPGALILVVANLPSTPVQSPFGDLWLQFPGFLIDAGVVPPTRTRSHSYVLPPLLRGESFVYQAIELLANGPLVISPPTVVVLN